MIKNIVFDFGGVLLDWNPRYLYKGYFKSDKEMEHFLTEICSPAWNSELDRGLPFDEGVKMLQARYPEYAEAIRLYKDGWADMLHGEIHEGVELLKDMKKEGFRIYGLTNWSVETIGIAFGRYGFFSLFEGIVVSGEEKLIKPDSRIFEVLLERYSLKAEECVFIDDSPANVSAAASLGFNAVLFDEVSRVRSELSALLAR